MSAERYACHLCIKLRGPISPEVDLCFENPAAVLDHAEAVHHIYSTRAGETNEEALARFLAKFPEVRTCPDCIQVGAPWCARVEPKP